MKGEKRRGQWDLDKGKGRVRGRRWKVRWGVSGWRCKAALWIVF
jgi:hypothetical protein